MGRTFTFQKATKTGSGEGLLDIPHPAVFFNKTPQDLIDKFKVDFGVLPKGVILPTVAPDGLLYECSDIALPRSRYASGNYFADTVAAFAGIKGIEKIYLSMDPTFHFVRTDALHVVDIAGDGSQQVCIMNQKVQELIGAVLGIGIDLTLATLAEAGTSAHLAGAVIDVVDLWPQGASDERLELTCFCESCVKIFEKEEKGLVDKFKTFPNPWNLVLKDNGTGIGYIDTLPKNVNEQKIIGLSRQKGYIDLFKDTNEATLLQHAKDLLRYMQIRHNQTALALHAIFNEAFRGLAGEKLHRILLSEGVHFDWTSGMQLQRLDEPDTGTELFNELWFNSTSSEAIISNTPFRSYMWRRSRYLIDAFFQTVAAAADPVKRNTTGIARFSEAALRDELLPKRLGSAVSTNDSSLASLAALPSLKEDGKTGGRVGFVGVAFFDEGEGKKFLRTIPIAPSAQDGKKQRSEQDEMLEMLMRRLADKD